MLKLAASELAYPLSFVFNVSLETGGLSSDWKSSNIFLCLRKAARPIPETIDLYP